VVDHTYRSAIASDTVETLAEAIDPGWRQVRVWVRDRGWGRAPPGDPGMRGRGLRMMSALMREVLIRPRPDSGTEIMMLTPPVLLAS
jgi:anti-sigma regulatory factor (Ser/Thr protein kinase)